jgi:hypothetical protein
MWIGVEGTRPVIIMVRFLEGAVPVILRFMEGTPPPTGSSPTQPYKCGQYVKVKVKIKTNAVLASLR